MIEPTGYANSLATKPQALTSVGDTAIIVFLDSIFFVTNSAFLIFIFASWAFTQFSTNAKIFLFLKGTNITEPMLNLWGLQYVSVSLNADLEIGWTVTMNTYK